MISLSEIAKQRLLGAINNPDVIDVDDRKYLVVDNIEITINLGGTSIIDLKRNGIVAHKISVNTDYLRDIKNDTLTITFSSLHALFEIGIQ
jgi:hypothetical protein